MTGESEIVRSVLAKCDELERYAPDERDDYDAGMRQAVREIREVVGKGHVDSPERLRSSAALRQFIASLRAGYQ